MTADMQGASWGMRHAGEGFCVNLHRTAGGLADRLTHRPLGRAGPDLLHPSYPAPALLMPSGGYRYLTLPQLPFVAHPLFPSPLPPNLLNPPTCFSPYNPGSCNNLCDTAPDAAEWAGRDAANIAWLRDTFAQAKAQGAAAVMIVSQATPGW